jgi:hypothetical protein
MDSVHVVSFISLKLELEFALKVRGRDAPHKASFKLKITVKAGNFGIGV